MTTPREDAIAALRPDDANKLRVLATWFDHFDDWREATGRIAPGIAEYREVQEDLRRIADAIAATNRTNVLRGDTIPAANIAKTHCPKGHELTERSGGRYCLTCNRARNRAWLDENRSDRRESQKAAYWADPEHYRAKKRASALREPGQ